MLLIRRIRELLYEQGFTINGARNKLDARKPVENEQVDFPEPHEVRAELAEILKLLQ